MHKPRVMLLQLGIMLFQSVI